MQQKLIRQKLKLKEESTGQDLAAITERLDGLTKQLQETITARGKDLETIAKMENEAASAGATIQEQAVAADKLKSEMLELKKSSSSEVRRLQDEIAAAKQAADANDAKYKKDLQQVQAEMANAKVAEDDIKGLRDALEVSEAKYADAVMKGNEMNSKNQVALDAAVKNATESEEKKKRNDGYHGKGARNARIKLQKLNVATIAANQRDALQSCLRTPRTK